MSWLNFPVAHVATRACSAGALFAIVLLPLHFVRAAVPNYKLGDVAIEDVITPVPLVVPHPEETDALKEKVSLQAPAIVRFVPNAAAEVEAELRASIASARPKFMIALDALQNRAPLGSDLGTPRYEAALAFALNNSPHNLPVEKLSRLWIRGQSDEAFVGKLLAPLLKVMAQPIIASSPTDPALPENASVQLLPVKSFSEPVTIDTVESAGQAVNPDVFISLARARQQVESSFAAGEEQDGNFASSFVRANAVYDPRLTEVVRAKRILSFAVNDVFEAAQIVVRKGQIIDRRALSALAVLREKSLIGALQTKLEHEQTVAGKIESQTKWIVSGLGIMALTLMLILWRLRVRPAESLVPAFAPSTLSGPALPGSSEESTWQNRALLAEGKAERAHAAIRSGVLGWMREKLFRTVVHQRAELLSAQQNAEAEMRDLEQRLEQLRAPLQERISTYEKRIQELEAELAAKLQAPETTRPMVATSEEADRHFRPVEQRLAERERDIRETEIRLAEQARELDETAALLRARETLLSSPSSRRPATARPSYTCRTSDPVEELSSKTL